MVQLHTCLLFLSVCAVLAVLGLELIVHHRHVSIAGFPCEHGQAPPPQVSKHGTHT